MKGQKKSQQREAKKVQRMSKWEQVVGYEAATGHGAVVLASNVRYCLRATYIEACCRQKLPMRVRLMLEGEVEAIVDV